MVDYTIECEQARDRALYAAREEIRIFACIMHISVADSWLVGDTDKRGGDPHGIACFGDYSFNMSDVHEVIKNYPKLLEKYNNNDGIAMQIIRYYDKLTTREKFPINLRNWLLGAPEPTEEEIAESHANVEELKEKLQEEADKYNQQKQF